MNTHQEILAEPYKRDVSGEVRQPQLRHDASGQVRNTIPLADRDPPKGRYADEVAQRLAVPAAPVAAARQGVVKPAARVGWYTRSAGSAVTTYGNEGPVSKSSPVTSVILPVATYRAEQGVPIAKTVVAAPAPIARTGDPTSVVRAYPRPPKGGYGHPAPAPAYKPAPAPYHA